MDNKLKSMISLCKRSGNLLSGEVQVSNALAKKKVKLIIIANDVSENTKNTFINKSNYYKIECVQFGDRDELNALIGDNNKAIFAIVDDNFAKRIKELILVEA